MAAAVMPAVRADSTPARASSTPAQSSGGSFSSWAARRNTSGSGLERVIWFPSTTRSRRASKPVRVRITPAFLLLEARPSR